MEFSVVTLRFLLVSIILGATAGAAFAQSEDAPAQRRFGQPAVSPPATVQAVPGAGAQTPSPAQRRFGQPAVSAPVTVQAAPAETPSPAQRRFGQAPAPIDATAAPQRRFGGAGTQASVPGKSTTAFQPPPRDADGQVYVYQGKTFAPFRVARYRPPPGQTYQRIDKGSTLPRNFWLARYFVTDCAAFGLPAPVQGFQWVRYGPDILLINLSSGVADDLITDFFEERAEVADVPLNSGLLQ